MEQKVKKEWNVVKRSHGEWTSLLVVSNLQVKTALNFKIVMRLTFYTRILQGEICRAFFSCKGKEDNWCVIFIGVYRRWIIPYCLCIHCLHCARYSGRKKIHYCLKFWNNFFLRGAKQWPRNVLHSDDEDIINMYRFFLQICLRHT